MWRLVTACDKYHFNLSMPKPWYAIWYQKHNIDQYYTKRGTKDRLGPRSLLCWIFDHVKGFMGATRFLTYNSVGHITEHNPTIHHDLRLESRVIQQFNAAKGRLRAVIHKELFRPNESCSGYADVVQGNPAFEEKGSYCYTIVPAPIRIEPITSDKPLNSTTTNKRPPRTVNQPNEHFALQYIAQHGIRTDGCSR